MKRKLVPDEEIIAGIQAGGPQRKRSEEILYKQFMYLVWKRPKRFALTEEAAVDAYTMPSLH
ncbi:MAG: hypothetical protein AAF206_21635 [Bacteroidota bacterium]